MSKFPAKAKKYVESLVKPLLIDGLQGTASVSVQDGLLDVVVPVSELDHRRLTAHQSALSALLGALAHAHATELPEGVLTDAVGVRLHPLGMTAAKKTSNMEPIAKVLQSFFPEVSERFVVTQTIEIEVTGIVVMRKGFKGYLRNAHDSYAVEILSIDKTGRSKRSVSLTQFESGKIGIKFQSNEQGAKYVKEWREGSLPTILTS